MEVKESGRATIAIRIKGDTMNAGNILWIVAGAVWTFVGVLRLIKEEDKDLGVVFVAIGMICFALSMLGFKVM